MPEHDYGFDDEEEQKNKIFYEKERKRLAEKGFIELDRDLREILNVKWIHKDTIKKLRDLILQIDHEGKNE